MGRRLGSLLRQRRLVLLILVGTSALVLYGWTSAPSIVELYDDSLEFQLVLPTFAIAHPTGYPLYTLLGGLWSRVLFPFGNWAWRVNLLSAATGALAVGVVYLLARRLSHDSVWAGLAAATTFGLSPLWWQQATVAEVYTLHNLFVAAILYQVVGLTGAGRQQSRAATGLFLLVGLSLTHHRTTFLLLPGLALFLAWKVPSMARPQRRWWLWASALCLPLLLYLYIPLRAAMGAGALAGDYANTWSGFWRHVLASGYTGFFGDNPLAHQRSAADWFDLVHRQVGWLGLALAGVGLVAGLLAVGQRAAWILVAIVFGLHAAFVTLYRVGDAEVFGLPALLCLALATGNGVARLGRSMSGVLGRILPGLLVVSLGLYPLGRAPGIDRSDDWAVHDYAVAMAKVDFAPGSLVVGLGGQTTALRYMQEAEGLGINATPVAIDDPEQRRHFVVDAVAAGAAVYLTQELAGIEEAYSFSGEGPLVRVWPRGAARSGTPAIPLDQPVAGGTLALVGYDAVRLAQAGGPALRIGLYWRPTGRLTQNLKLSLRLLDAEGSILHSQDLFPLHQVALTSAWRPGEIVRDVHYLPMPAGAEALLIIPYDAATVTEVGRITVELP